MITESNYFIKN